MAEHLSPREQALRRLPLVYSLVLRLREAGVAAELICDYVDVDEGSLDNIFRVAEAKLRAAQLAGLSPIDTEAETTSDGLEGTRR